MFDYLLVNGDSYTADEHEQQVYAGTLGKLLGVPSVNIAWHGANNDRIVRTTIEKVLELKSQGHNPLVVIAWSFIRRQEVWYHGNNQNVINSIPDRDASEETQNPRFVTLDVLIRKNAVTVEQKFLIDDDLFFHKRLTDFYTNMYLLANTLDGLGIEWFMFSGANNTKIPSHYFSYIQSLEQFKWCQVQPNIYKIHEFCIPDWGDENGVCRLHPHTGHLIQTGHTKFASTLFEWLRNVKNVR